MGDGPVNILFFEINIGVPHTECMDLYRMLRGTRTTHAHAVGFMGGRCEMSEVRISMRSDGLQIVLHDTVRQTIRIPECMD
jgi:hypothetical protein